MKNLGYKTDCLFHTQLGEVVQRQRYWVIRNSDNPTFRWGNLLVYPEAPKSMIAKQWLIDFRKEFGENSSHVTLGWESDALGELELFKKWGFEYEPLSVMTLSDPPSEYLGEEMSISDFNVHLREIKSDEDWRQLMDLHFETYMENTTDSSTAFRVFMVQKYANYRKLAEAGRGFWMGAFEGGKLVGSMGLFWDLNLKVGRFQNVETAAAFRRRGICSALLRYVIRISSLLCGLRTWVIVAEVGSGAERLYLSQGFRRVGMQQGVCLPKMFAYDLLI